MFSRQSKSRQIARRRIFSPDASPVIKSPAINSTRNKLETEEIMTEVTWTAPEACEICCGMEVTSYMSAEI